MLLNEAQGEMFLSKVLAAGETTVKLGTFQPSTHSHYQPCESNAELALHTPATLTGRPEDQDKG